MQKITYRDLGIGMPISYNCYDGNGILLLRRGQVIHSERQLEALISRGLFAIPASTKTQPVLPNEEKNSPFDFFDSCRDRMHALFTSFKLNNGVDLPESINFDELRQSYRDIICGVKDEKLKDFPARILNVCQGIQAMCKTDADAALGSIHLDQGGRYTTAHPMHKAILSELIASRLGLPPEDRLSIMAAALTANISIIELQEALHKQKTPLSESQNEMIRLHPMLSVEMLAELGVTDDLWFKTVLYHHEKPDGSGYPCGLEGANIPISVRIVSLADIYSAMISRRSYRNAILAKEALKEIFLNRGGNLDGDLAQTFIKEIGFFPPGVFVKLQNSETAIVTYRGATPSTPKVKSVLGPRGAPLAYPISRDTENQDFLIRETVPRDNIVPIDFRLLWDYR